MQIESIYANELNGQENILRIIRKLIRHLPYELRAILTFASWIITGLGG